MVSAGLAARPRPAARGAAPGVAGLKWGICLIRDVGVDNARVGETVICSTLTPRPRLVPWPALLVAAGRLVPALLATLLFAAALLPAPRAEAAPAADPWPRWLAHDAASGIRVDHTPWARWLGTYLHTDTPDGINRVPYGRVSPADRAALEAYVRGMTAVPVDSLTRNEQLAYWINLYNALTVQVVLAHHPVESIRDIDISPGWFADGPWDAKLLTIAGERLSLNDIEHRILRPLWRDPRIHYAVNCASLGCPNLQPAPYDARRIDAQLDAAARAFVNHPRGVRFDDGELVVSSIYAWFQEDFGGTKQGVIRHLLEFAGTSLADRLRRHKGGFDDAYDWRLNASGGQ